jgi:hypothetical protein
MGCAMKPRNLIALRLVCSGITSYLLAAAISLEMANPAAAQVTDLMADDTDLGDINVLHHPIVTHTFTATGGTPPYSWDPDSLTTTAGSPAEAPTLTADGNFSWNSHGSPFGRYMWEATITDNAGLNDVGSLGLNLIVPEPSTAMLLLVAAALQGRRFRRRTCPQFGSTRSVA